MKRNKYNNKKITINGIKFDSLIEGNCYRVFKELLDCGKIDKLETQPLFEFILNKRKICTYRADFRVIIGNKELIIDVKSDATSKNSTYRIKNKLMWAFYNIKIIEIKKIGEIQCLFI